MYGCTLIQIYTAEFWVHTGNITTTADKRRYTPVHDICSNLDDTHCDIFPEIHSLTGCDTVSVMYGLGGNCYESAYKVYIPI